MVLRKDGVYRSMVEAEIIDEVEVLAAAMCAKEKVQPRDLDVNRLRKKLVDNGVVL